MVMPSMNSNGSVDEPRSPADSTTFSYRSQNSRNQHVEPLVQTEGNTNQMKLYEAYSELHALAQEMKKPMKSPCIVVVGHQTDGKSALVEALMGFQFNHVGGGTKTRRPVTLHMMYNPQCHKPQGTLYVDHTARDMKLEEIQDYILKENSLLEQLGQFSNDEIVVKIQYKFCPNLSIIDMPGLISAVAGRKNQNLDLVKQSQQVEDMVRAKLECNDYTILCLEDNGDWSNATTRKLIHQIDPNYDRTLVVATKLDTKIPQFSTNADVDTFMRPVPNQLMDQGMLAGGPFFTSVPSGRVGMSRESKFANNDAFRKAIFDQEMKDQRDLQQRLGTALDPVTQSRVGVSKLRRYLERLLLMRYQDSMPTVMATLNRERMSTGQSLERSKENLADLSPDRLKERGRRLTEGLIKQLNKLMRGTPELPSEEFGQTLVEEQQEGGMFMYRDGSVIKPPEDLPNSSIRLYGGAQYSRAMTEFKECVGRMSCPQINKEEMVNACGLDQTHSAVDYFRTAAIIAVTKGKENFEPFIAQLGARLSYIKKRMLLCALHLLHKHDTQAHLHDNFFKRVANSYNKFVDQTEQAVHQKCKEDIEAVTKYVTWSLHEGPDLGKALEKIGNLQNPAYNQGRSSNTPKGGNNNGNNNNNNDAINSGSSISEVVNAIVFGNRVIGDGYEDIIKVLVSHMYQSIRDHLVLCYEMKFNRFFMMEITEEFPSKVRKELESAYEVNLDLVFDTQMMKTSLLGKVKHLEKDLECLVKVQRKFVAVQSTIKEMDTAMHKEPNDLQNYTVESIPLVAR